MADPVVIWGAPEVKNDFKVILNGGVEAGTGELYGFGGWSGRDVDGSFFYRNPNTRSGVFAGTDGNLLVADLTPDDDMPCRAVPVIDGLAVPEALNEVIDDPNCFVYNEWFPSGFTPRFGGEVADSFVTGGWRGARGDLEYDFSVSAGRNELIYRIRNTVNASYGPNSPTAFDLGVGAVFSLGAVNVSVDWFQIDVDDRIALTQQSLSDRDRAELLDANIIGAETVTAVSFFVNDIRSETTGVDLVVDSGFDWGGGRANITVAGNVTRTKILERGATLSDAAARELEDALPDSRLALTVDYARGAFSGLLRMNYYDDVYEHLFNCESCAITMDAMSVFDAKVSWAVSGTYSVALGVHNLLDKLPDEHQFAGVAGYLGADFPLNHPSGLNGGSYYLRLNAEF